MSTHTAKLILNFRLTIILGLVGCVLGIVSAYWDIKKAQAMGTRDGKYLFIYGVTQMVLGIIEAVIVVGEIVRLISLIATSSQESY